jgi:hypothetical protein
MAYLVNFTSRAERDLTHLYEESMPSIPMLPGNGTRVSSRIFSAWKSSPIGAR